MSDKEDRVRAAAKEFGAAIADAIDHGLRVDLPSAWQDLEKIAISETGKLHDVTVGAAPAKPVPTAVTQPAIKN